MKRIISGYIKVNGINEAEGYIFDIKVNPIFELTEEEKKKQKESIEKPNNCGVIIPKQKRKY